MAMDRKAMLLLIPLIIAIVVIIGLIAAVVWMKGDYEIKDRQISTLKSERENQTRKFATAEYDRQNLARFIAGREDDNSEILRKRWLQGGPENEYLEKYKLSSPEARQRFETLTDVYKQIFQERLNCLNRAITAIKSEEAAREDLVKAQEAFTEAKSRLESEKQDLSDEKSRIDKDFEKYKTEATAEMARLTKALDDLYVAKDEERKKFEMDIASLYSQISELERRIQTIIKKKPQELMSCDPDGGIILADNKLGIAWIDLGRQDGLRVGHIFSVFRYIKGGRRKIKGEIEVKVIQDKMSQAAIIQCLEPEDDPIVKGDHIISPLFDKKKAPVFVFSGELVNPLYSKKEVTKKIEEMGGKVAREVTVETDFLIAGKGAEETEEYTKAIDLGIVIMREDELFRYIGR
jgi:NAD-dependent DNA ligase